jgi:hypothetical protein
MLKHREDKSVNITSIALRSEYHVETTGSEETHKWSPLVLIDSDSYIQTKDSKQTHHWFLDRTRIVAWHETSCYTGTGLSLS